METKMTDILLGDALIAPQPKNTSIPRLPIYPVVFSFVTEPVKHERDPNGGKRQPAFVADIILADKSFRRVAVPGELAAYVTEAHLNKPVVYKDGTLYAVKG